MKLNNKLWTLNFGHWCPGAPNISSGIQSLKPFSTWMPNKNAPVVKWKNPDFSVLEPSELCSSHLDYDCFPELGYWSPNVVAWFGIKNENYLLFLSLRYQPTQLNVKLLKQVPHPGTFWGNMMNWNLKS